MNGLNYILNTHIAIVILYLLYLTAFRRKLAPSLARIYLIAIIPLSLLISAIRIEAKGIVDLLKSVDFDRGYIIAGELSEETDIGAFGIEGADAAESAAIQSASLGDVLIWFYIIGLTATLLITAFKLYRTYRLIVNMKDSSEAYAFSIMGKEYIGGDIEENLLGAIRIHEKAHIRLYHHIDLVYMLICRNILWFNPIIWHINYLLKEVHEYEADKKVIEAGYSSRNYAEMLINVEMGYLSPYIVHSFSYKSTKNRIIMLKKNNSKSRYLRILYVFPVIALLFGLICCKGVQEEITILPEEPEVTEVTESEPIIQEEPKEEAIPFAFAGVKPKFINEDGTLADPNAFTRWVSKNLNYPEDAKSKEIQGRILLEFVIEKDGSVGGVKVLRGVDSSLDAEAVRVVKSSPKWIPGEQDGKQIRVVYRFPVIFQLKGSLPKTETKSSDTQAKTNTYIVSADGTIPFSFVEKKPAFPDPNGDVTDNNAFTRWVSSNMNYPPAAMEKEIQGRVLVEFTVKKDGTVADVKVLRGVDPLLDQEAVRIIEASPKWIPGEQGGNTVDVIYRFPVIFQLR